KTAVVIPPQNDVDLHANDLNFIAIGDNGQLTGFNGLVGGGLAMTHGDQSTYPRLATELGYIPLNATLAVATAVVATQRDL
ncbi:sulfite reductase subunit beta, partial [Klebsiella pneumoniae]|nr:sulfite reductase subunit beta [Klebsiella pneumoniae]